MAWFSNLAEKAEDLLNRLDHNASLVLVQNDSKDSSDYNISDNSESSDLAPASVITQSSNEETNFSSETEDSFNDGSSLNNLWKNNSSPVHSAHFEHDNTGNKYLPYPAESDSFLLSDSTTVINYLNKFKETTNKIQELENRLEELEVKYLNSQKEIIELKSTVTDYEGKNSILKSRLKQAMASLSANQEEMEKHRNKAQKILEDKERLVAQIENSPVTSASNEHIEYVSKLIKTRDDQQKSIDELNEKFELVQNDLAATQKQCSIFQDEAFTARQTLQKNEKIRLALEDELVQSKQELCRVYEELKEHINILNIKNDEIVHLQKQTESRSTSNENEELESKFHVLTKTLIMKQNSLETLTTERNALRLQLERIESDYSRILIELNTKQSSSVLNIDSYDEGKSNLFTMSPFDEGVTRKVKRAISTINTFSIRLGVFLRRYPVARIFLLCYMILLQIWVVVILFAYVPSSY